MPRPEEGEAADGGPDPEDAPPGVVFDRLRSFAGREKPGLLAPLEGGRIVDRGPNHLRIAVPTSFSAKRLEHKRRELEAACARFFGREIRIEIETAGEGPIRDASIADPETLRSRRQQALNNPAVSRAIEVLGGEIVEIRPVGDRR
jgi:hypothetical protein